jgi:hypothetical protein
MWGLWGERGPTTTTAISGTLAYGDHRAGHQGNAEGLVDGGARGDAGLLLSDLEELFFGANVFGRVVCGRRDELFASLWGLWGERGPTATTAISGTLWPADVPENIKKEASEAPK